jgi:non-specific serine/threonine protein kinase
MGMAGETVWPVPPLALPVAHAAGTVPLEQLARVESVQLLVARAQTIRPDFRLDAENAAAVVQVCRRLDGLPLAIELAAARLQSLTLHDLAARIDDRFRLLRRGDRSAQPRHQTLQAMMDWSYDLLDATERLVLRRLAVFAGGCTLAAAERVCSGDGVEEADVVDVLDELTRKSLIQADAGEAEATRYRLLEIVRHYAADRLVEANEQETLRARHLSWCLELADAAAPGLNGPQQSRWLAQLEAEHDNLRAALRWVLDAPDGDHLTAGLEVAGAIWRFWETRGYASEGRAWLDALLAHGPPASEAAAAARGRALLGAGVLAHVQGDYARAVAYQEEGLAIWRSLGDGPGLIASLNLLGIIAKSRGDYTRADEFYAEALTMARNLGQQGRIATLLGNMGTVARLQGDYVRATTLYEEALSIARARGDGQVVTRVLSYLAAVAGDTNEQQRAAALYRESLRQSWSLNDRRYIPICLEGLAGTVGGDSERTVDVVRNAVVLLACSAALRASLSTPLSPAEQAPVERTLAALRAALPDAQFAAAWAEGTALPLEEAINLALAGQP